MCARLAQRATHRCADDLAVALHDEDRIVRQLKRLFRVGERLVVGEGRSAGEHGGATLMSGELEVQSDEHGYVVLARAPHGRIGEAGHRFTDRVNVLQTEAEPEERIDERAVMT